MFDESRQVWLYLARRSELNRASARLDESQHFCFRLITSEGHIAADENDGDDEEDQTDRDEGNDSAKHS
jgi:hypothetical protein